MVLRLFIANAAVYLGLKLLWLAAPALGVDFDTVAAELLLPPTFAGLVRKPWTLLTYMFTHCDFRHLLVNMLWLGGFGTFLGREAGSRRVFWLYVFGGVSSAAMYLLSSLTPFAPADSLSGASGAVIALTVASGIMLPDTKVKLTYIGAVTMRKIVPLALLAFFFCTLPEAMAHAGGLLAGVAAALVWRNSVCPAGFGARHANREPASAATSSAAVIIPASDEYAALVAKVNAEGYEALLPAERRRLYELTLIRASRG